MARRLSRVRDWTLTALSWVPSERVPFPILLVLIAAPALYLLITPGGLFSPPGEVEEEVLARSRVAGRGRVVKSSRSRRAPASPEDPFHIAFGDMVEELERQARRHPARVAIYVKDLQRGWEWAYHADDLFPSASLIKAPIMAGVFEKINRGELSLNSKLKLRRRVRMGGSGTVKWHRDGTRFTVRRLLEKLIHESDNTAMLILIDEVGMGFLQQYFADTGLVYTEIYADGLRLTGGRVRYENYTTAREMGLLFEKMYRGQIVDEFASELMLDILKRRPTRSRLAKGLPVGWEIAHKTGLLRRACHDVGIIFSPNGDYVVAVLTGRNRTYGSAKEFITRVGKITFKHYRSDPGFYVRAPGKSKPTRRK
ncbi:serine hydrolase [Elusimicrobiota bacterium]